MSISENFYYGCKQILPCKRIGRPCVGPIKCGHGLVRHDGRVYIAREPPQLHRRHERRTVAGLHQADRRPACPRHEHCLFNNGRTGVVAREGHAGPVVTSELQVELRGCAGVVVVAIQEPQPDQVLVTGDGWERVAVARASREAPESMETGVRRTLVVIGYPVVFSVVDERSIGDVLEAGVLVLVPTEVGVQAAVDAQGSSTSICFNITP